MIKTITDYQSLTLSMIRVPNFQETVEDKIHMLYRNESTNRKSMFQGKKIQGGIDEEVEGVDQHSFLRGENTMQVGKSFFQGGLRGVLPSMVTLPLLLVSHKMIFCENKAVHLCVTMQKLARAFVATIQCITFSYSFCR